MFDSAADVFDNKDEKCYQVTIETLEKEFFSENDFKLLFQKAHQLGMKVMLDISFTYCSHENPMFVDVLEKKINLNFMTILKQIWVKMGI